MTIFVGIDNGTTGSIGFVGGDLPFLVLSKQYTRPSTLKSGKGNEINPRALFEIFQPIANRIGMVAIERPFTAVGMGNAPVLGRGAFEATRTVLELLEIPFMVVDSKQWQKLFLPAGIKGSKELKEASKALGTQQWPICSEEIKRQGDADGLFLARLAMKMKNG